MDMGGEVAEAGLVAHEAVDVDQKKAAATGSVLVRRK